MNEIPHITRTETARLIRAALKKAFPAARFSIRTTGYAGGGSIDITWTDGPALSQVESIATPYESQQWDGSVDLAADRTHWLLPDGSVQIAESGGTARSGGVLPDRTSTPPHPDARRVSLGIGYVALARRYSTAFLTAIARQVAAEHDVPAPSVHDSPTGAYLTPSSQTAWYVGGTTTIAELVWRRANQTAV